MGPPLAISARVLPLLARCLLIPMIAICRVLSRGGRVAPICASCVSRVAGGLRHVAREARPGGAWPGAQAIRFSGSRRDQCGGGS